MPALVSALNRVDLPTFGKPTMPHFISYRTRTSKILFPFPAPWPEEQLFPALSSAALSSAALFSTAACPANAASALRPACRQRSSAATAPVRCRLRRRSPASLRQKACAAHSLPSLQIQTDGRRPVADDTTRAGPCAAG